MEKQWKNETENFFFNSCKLSLALALSGAVPAQAWTNAEVESLIVQASSQLEVQQSDVDGGWGDSDAQRFLITASAVQALLPLGLFS